MTVSNKTPGKPNAISMLIADHKKAHAAFEAYDAIKDTDRKKAKSAIVKETCADLTIHMKIEEEIFYPAARKAIKDNDLMDEATVEHAGAKALIAELQAMQPGDDLYDAKFKVLGENVDHHVKEEQDDMFPKVRKTTIDLGALGVLMAERKAELQSGRRTPHLRNNRSKT